MKKLLVVLLTLIALFVTACSSNTANINAIDSEDITTNDNNIESEQEEQEEPEEEKEEVPINLEDIKPEITILEPDSIGTVYMEATYTNNSDYPIVGYSLEVLLKDKNEKAYLVNYDTVLPGETSPKFEGFGPETRKPEDYEILKLEVTAKTEEGKLYIEYDMKLGEATWFEAEE